MSGNPIDPPRRAIPWLHQELSRWQAEGLVTPEQAAAIGAGYPMEAHSTRNRTSATFVILGSLLTGLGIILWVASNWQRFGPEAKLTLIFGTVLVCHGLGWWLWQQPGRYPRTGHALVFLGNLAYGAGIWLIAQIFHLNAHWPTGLLFWSIGTAAVAWAVASQPSLLLATGLLAAWTASEQVAFYGANWLFLPLAVALGALAWRLREPLALAMVWGSFAFWFAVDVYHWLLPPGLRTNEEAGVLTAFTAAAFLGAAVWALYLDLARTPHGRQTTWIVGLLGALTAMIALYVQTFDWRYEMPRTAAGGWVALGVAAALAVAAVLWQWRRPGAEGPVRWGAAAPLAVNLVGLGLLLAAPPAGWRLLAFNLLLLAAIIGLVVFGYRQQQESQVNLGLFAFAVLVITRYFDMFYTLLDRSLFFVAGGLLLLAGGWLLERNRRRLIANWQREGEV